MADFNFQGKHYRTAANGSLEIEANDNEWLARPIRPGTDDAALAAAAKQADPTWGVAPAADLPDTPPTGISAPASVHQTGTTSTALPTTPPTPTTAKPAPAGGPGSATELRTERDRVQKQLDDVQARIDKQRRADPDYEAPPEITNQITALNNRIATLTNNISTLEAHGPTVISGQNTTEKYLVRANPDGTIIVDPATGKPPLNPNWDGKSVKAQTGTIGNHIYTIGDEGNIVIAYTDKDQQELAQRQTAVAESNARVAAAQQAVDALVAKSRLELEQRVANGEDAASVRAQQAQDLAAAHQTWVEADGDARRKQEELRDYNTERHTNAAEQLSQDTLANTKQWQAMQDATARRGQDITAADSKASRETTAKTSLANQRLSTGGAYLGNVLSVLSALNRDVAPGSSAVGDMLMPLLAVGKNYFGSLGGLDSPDAITGAAPAAAPAAVDPTKPLVVPNAVPPTLAATAPDLGATQTPSQTTNDWFEAWQKRQEEDRKQQLAAAAMRNQGGYFPMMAEGGIVTQPTLAMVGEAGPEAVVPLNKPPAPSPMGILSIIGDFLSKLGGVADSPGATPPLAPVPQPAVDPSAALAGQAAAAGGLPPSAAANPMLPGSAQPGVLPAAAAQQARMNPIAPDGSPYASPQDVAARLQARRGGRPMLGGSPPSTAPAPGAA